MNASRIFWLFVSLVAVAVVAMWLTVASNRRTSNRLDQLATERQESVQRTRASIDSMKAREKRILANQDTIKQLLRDRR